MELDYSNRDTPKELQSSSTPLPPLHRSPPSAGRGPALMRADLCQRCSPTHGCLDVFLYALQPWLFAHIWTGLCSKLNPPPASVNLCIWLSAEGGSVAEMCEHIYAGFDAAGLHIAGPGCQPNSSVTKETSCSRASERSNPIYPFLAFFYFLSQGQIL